MPPLDFEGAEGFLARRGFIQVMAAAAATPLLSGCAGLLSYIPPAIGYHPKPNLVTPFVTPNEEFYMVAIDPAYRPAFDLSTVAESWALVLVGLAGSRRVSYAELDAAAQQKVFYTFECIGNPVGGTLIGNAEWRVVPLKELLASAPGGLDGVRSVMLEAMDGFYSSVCVERATDDYAFVAVEMNGVTLPAEHGFPARVILPDLTGKSSPAGFPGSSSKKPRIRPRIGRNDSGKEGCR